MDAAGRNPLGILCFYVCVFVWSYVDRRKTLDGSGAGFGAGFGAHSGTAQEHGHALGASDARQLLTKRVSTC